MKNCILPRWPVAFLPIILVSGLMRVEAQTKSATLSHFTLSLPSNHHPRNEHIYDSYSIRQLTYSAANDVQPTWSPDGSTIAFISDSIGGSDGYDLFAISPDGTGLHALAYFTITDYWGGRFYDPSWLSNSGDMLVMDFKTFWEVLRFDLKGALANNVVPVTRSVADGDSPYMKQILFVPGGYGAMSPIVSPDTSKLAWFAHITPNGTAPDQTVQQVRIYSGNLTSYIGNSNSAGVSIFQTNPGGYLDDAKSIAFSPDGSNLVVSACMSGWYDSGKRRDFTVSKVAQAMHSQSTVTIQAAEIISTSITMDTQDTILSRLTKEQTCQFLPLLLEPLIEEVIHMVRFTLTMEMGTGQFTTILYCHPESPTEPL